MSRLAVFLIPFQHTAARRRLGRISTRVFTIRWFQHTAARRRLEYISKHINSRLTVSTHSRPKAAGENILRFVNYNDSFNTQPPEGGWFFWFVFISTHYSFNTQPPEGGWFFFTSLLFLFDLFQHTAARRRLGHSDRQYRLDHTVSTHSRPKAAGASLKSLATSGFAALISLSSQEKRKREYNTAFSVTPAFAIS